MSTKQIAWASLVGLALPVLGGAVYVGVNKQEISTLKARVDVLERQGIEQREWREQINEAVIETRNDVRWIKQALQGFGGLK